MQRTCSVTGWTFEPMAQEMMLRRKLGIEGEPHLHPVFRFMLLGAFWQHWNLYKRTCGKTGRSIISVYPEDCPYPVWHKDEWVKDADPPGADFVEGKPVFPQLWAFFSRSPIAHNMGTGCENCEYTDDYWFSRNCYLCHSGYECEDLRYCYRGWKLRDSQFCDFANDCERCVDVINCKTCQNLRFCLNSTQCSDSSFLYDCRNCTHCFLCANLRSKQYCFRNAQLTKQEYEDAVKEWDLRSRASYDRAREEFLSMLRQGAWHRALLLDLTEDATGNYSDGIRHCQNCYFCSAVMEDCVNIVRAANARDCLDCVSMFGSELVYCSVNVQDRCYDIRFCADVIQCRSMEYSAHCLQCEQCFGCCGLVGRKYHIFNKPYAPADFERLKKTIVQAMQRTGEYGQFFPASFAATSYNETIAGHYWPLERTQAQSMGFRFSQREAPRPAGALDASQVPDRSDAATSTLTNAVFWDDMQKRVFQIQKPDIAFAQAMGVPLPAAYYTRRLEDNFRLMPFDGSTRATACGRCSAPITTSWPAEYDGRILCEECYRKEVY